VRTGCTVQVSSTARDTIDVAIAFSDADFVPPRLPGRRDREYGTRELDELESGAGLKIIGAGILAAAVLSATQLALGPFLAQYIAFILSRGIRTDEYDALPEINILDSGSAVREAPADNIPAGVGVVVDNQQPYPIFGWLELRRVPVVIL
jgi:hypothetical protein